MSQTISSEQYRKQFGDTTKQRAALEHALDIRKFEIELYWKRATYFWTFIGATFAGYGAVQLADKGQAAAKSDLSVILACFGFVLSFAWFCANRGSKQWQENWENHVDMLEDEIVGPLYKTVIKRPEPEGWYRLIEFINGPAPFSVSKINQMISFFVMLLWAALLVRTLVPFPTFWSVNVGYAAVLLLSFATCIALLWLGRTDDEPRRELVAQLRETAIAPLKATTTSSSDLNEEAHRTSAGGSG